MQKFILAITILFLVVAAPMATADTALLQWGFNFNGDVQTDYVPTMPGVPPAGWGADYSGFDFLGAGLGSINFQFMGAPGAYSFVVFFDHDLGPFPLDSNNGAAFGTPGAGQSWQVGPPGYPGDGGDTYFMFVANTLKNLNEIEPGEYGDVSAALGWNFVLAADETAIFHVIVSTTAPSSGFYLQEFDASGGDIIYFSNNLEIESINPAIPEPGTMTLLGTGMIAAAGWARRKLFP